MMSSLVKDFISSSPSAELGIPSVESSYDGAPEVMKNSLFMVSCELAKSSFDLYALRLLLFLTLALLTTCPLSFSLKFLICLKICMDICAALLAAL